ncbi:MAG: hypothetical protein R2722_03050 [Tessaracoccus sp.]
MPSSPRSSITRISSTLAIGFVAAALAACSGTGDALGEPAEANDDVVVQQEQPQQDDGANPGDSDVDDDGVAGAADDADGGNAIILPARTIDATVYVGGLEYTIGGSSYLRWGDGESAADEEHAQPVVVSVAEAAAIVAVELDEPVDGLGAAVGGSAGVEVGQEGVPPLLEGAAQLIPGWDTWGSWRRLVQRVGGFERVGWAYAARAMLGALPGDVDGVVALVGGDGSGQAGLLLLGEPLTAQRRMFRIPYSGRRQCR